MSDPISNLLTQIRNSTAIGKRQCETPYSRTKESVLKVMKETGYINGFSVDKDETERRNLKIELLPGRIRRINRLSKPGRRIYVGYKEIPTILRGYGTVIISTPKGVISGAEAKKLQVGGELICEVA